MFKLETNSTTIQAILINNFIIQMCNLKTFSFECTFRGETNSTTILLHEALPSYAILCMSKWGLHQIVTILETLNFLNKHTSRYLNFAGSQLSINVFVSIMQYHYLILLSKSFNTMSISLTIFHLPFQSYLMVSAKNHFLIFGFDPSNNHLTIEQHIYLANHNPQSYGFPTIQRLFNLDMFWSFNPQYEKIGIFWESCDMELFGQQIIQCLQPHSTWPNNFFGK